MIVIKIKDMKKTLLIAVSLFASLSSMAQIHIGMAQAIPAIDQDTIAPGHVDTYNVWVKNLDTASSAIFSDNIAIYTAIRDSAVVGLLDTVGTFNTVLPVTINPGDSAMFSLTATYNVGPAAYRYGIDVIVVWPVAASALATVDTLEYSVFIMDGAGVNELDIQQLLQVYPNPAVHSINIENKGNCAIESVQIYDLSGKLVVNVTNNTCINVEQLPAGMYNIQVNLTNKKSYYLKFMKPKNRAE